MWWAKVTYLRTVKKIFHPLIAGEYLSIIFRTFTNCICKYTFQIHSLPPSKHTQQLTTLSILYSAVVYIEKLTNNVSDEEKVQSNVSTDCPKKKRGGATWYILKGYVILKTESFLISAIGTKNEGTAYYLFN